MLATRTWGLACAIFATDALAQSSNIGECCRIDPNSVNLATRGTWCRAEISTCTTLCGSTSINTCDTNTLDFSCSCQNGTSPDMSIYSNTIPTYQCMQWKNQCVSAAGPDDLAAQQSCAAQLCGDKEAVRPPDSSSTASSVNSESTTPGSSPTASKLPATSTEKARTTSDGSPPPSPTIGSATAQNTPHGSPSLPAGAIAGIVIGVISGLGIILALLWFCGRWHKGKTFGNTTNLRDLRNDEKQVAVQPVSEIPFKPELHSDSNFIHSNLPQVVEQVYANNSEHPGSAELSSPHHQHHAELYASREYHGNLPQQEIDYNPVELHSATPRRELDGAAPLIAPVPLHPSHQHPLSQHEFLNQDTFQNDATTLNETHELYPKSPVQTTSSIRPLSPEAIAALEEEERRIDAEMEEVQKMKELREQKFAIQQKLREAKRGVMS